MNIFFKSIILISSLILLVNCGGGGNSTPPNPPPTHSLFDPPLLPIADQNNPAKIDYNVFKIEFVGKTYIEFTTTQEGEFYFASSGYGYNEPRFELFEYGTDNIVPFSFIRSDIYRTDDPLPPGKYTMKIYNDKTPSTGVYVSLLSTFFSGITLAELPVQNGVSAIVSPSFLSFWKFNVASNECIEIAGNYQDVYLYDSHLTDTGLDIDNNAECLSSGLYYIYFKNHTRYNQPFELIVH